MNLLRFEDGKTEQLVVPLFCGLDEEETDLVIRAKSLFWRDYYTSQLLAVFQKNIFSRPTISFLAHLVRPMSFFKESKGKAFYPTFKRNCILKFVKMSYPGEVNTVMKLMGNIKPNLKEPMKTNVNHVGTQFIYYTNPRGPRIFEILLQIDATLLKNGLIGYIVKPVFLRDRPHSIRQSGWQCAMIDLYK